MECVATSRVEWSDLLYANLHRMATHTYTHTCACMHAHAQKQRKGLSSCQMNEKDTAATLHNTKSFFLLCACWRLHTAGVCTSGFSWSAPPPATMLPVNPSLFIIRRDTPTRGRCIILRYFASKSNADAGSFPSLHLKAPGVWADARPCSGSAGRPASQPAGLVPHPH